MQVSTAGADAQHTQSDALTDDHFEAAADKISSTRQEKPSEWSLVNESNSESASLISRSAERTDILLSEEEIVEGV